jgi:hypothetical protein
VFLSQRLACCGWPSVRIWLGSRASPASTPSRTCGGIWCGARSGGLILWQRAGHTLSSTFRWLQEVRRYQPSTVSRPLSVVAGFYRTCVIDGVLEHSPAEYVRRPHVPAQSPTTPGSSCRGCTRTCSGTPSSLPCSTPASTCATYNRRPPRRPTNHHALRPRPQQPRPPPQLPPRRLHGLRHLTDLTLAPMRHACAVDPALPACAWQILLGVSRLVQARPPLGPVIGAARGRRRQPWCQVCGSPSGDGPWDRPAERA